MRRKSASISRRWVSLGLLSMPPRTTFSPSSRSPCQMKRCLHNLNMEHHNLDNTVLAVTSLRCRANMAHTRQSRPESGLGVQAMVGVVGVALDAPAYHLFGLVQTTLPNDHASPSVIRVRQGASGRLTASGGGSPSPETHRFAVIRAAKNLTHQPSVISRQFAGQHGSAACAEVPRSKETAPSQDPTVGLHSGSCGGPRGVSGFS